MSKSKQTRKAQLKQQKKKASQERRKPLARKGYLTSIKEARAAIREERDKHPLMNQLQKYLLEIIASKPLITREDISLELQRMLPSTLFPKYSFIMEQLEDMEWQGLIENVGIAYYRIKK